MSHYNVSKQDIVSFKQKDTYDSDLYNETMVWAKNQTPHLLHSVFKKIKTKSSTQDLKTWMDVLYKDKTANMNQQVNFFNFASELKQEDAEKRRQQILERLSRGE